MKVNVALTVELGEVLYSERKGIPIGEAALNLASEFNLMSDGLTWSVVSSDLVRAGTDNSSDVVRTILARPRSGSGGGIPLTRGEVAMPFLDGYAGDAPGLLDIHSQGYGDDDQWDGLTHDDVLAEPDTAFVWTKWEPLELWPDQCDKSAPFVMRTNSSSHSDA